MNVRGYGTKFHARRLGLTARDLDFLVDRRPSWRPFERWRCTTCRPYGTVWALRGMCPVIRQQLRGYLSTIRKTVRENLGGSRPGRVEGMSNTDGYLGLDQEILKCKYSPYSLMPSPRLSLTDHAVRGSTAPDHFDLPHEPGDPKNELGAAVLRQMDLAHTTDGERPPAERSGW